MGLSTSKTKTKTDSTSNQTGTTTPNLPPDLQSGLTGFTDKLNSLQGVDPYSTVAPQSPLQDQAYNNASQLGSWAQGIGHAAQMADQVGQAPANLANAFGYSAPQIGQTQLPNAVGSNVPTLGGANGYNPTLYGGASLGSSPNVTALNGTSSQLGTGQSYDPTVYGGAKVGIARHRAYEAAMAQRWRPRHGQAMTRQGQPRSRSAVSRRSTARAPIHPG
jgi:hypothetical protein